MIPVSLRVKPSVAHAMADLSKAETESIVRERFMRVRLVAALRAAGSTQDVAYPAALLLLLTVLIGFRAARSNVTTSGCINGR